jgi:predicted protein tyrosine phosphatase
MIQKSTRNQMYNALNDAQGSTKRVLTVCSAGLLRSATLQNLLIREYGYNVRNCGTVQSYALIMISEALCVWADEIVFVNQENYDMVKNDIINMGMEKKCIILDIPDIYNFNETALVNICREQYSLVERS